jgi:hypothetical protein
MKKALLLYAVCACVFLVLHDGRAFGQPITEIDVIEGNNANITRSGWLKCPTDLNKGARGKHIYIVYKRNSGKAPVTDFRVILGENTQPPTGFTKIGVDLNKGAGGEYIYLCYKRDNSLAPIDDITILEGRNAIKETPYITDPVDLNKGCGAKTPYLYLAFKRTGSKTLPMEARGALAGILREHLAQYLDGQRYDISGKNGFNGHVAPSKAKTDLNLTCQSMCLLSQPYQLVADFTLLCPVIGKASISGKLGSASSNLSAIVRVRLRVVIDLEFQGQRVGVRGARVDHIIGKAEGFSFHNEAAKILNRYASDKAEVAAEKTAVAVRTLVNSRLSQLTGNDRFILDLQKYR